MKLNNKGISIIELIVSVALISVIMIFMYQLLSDVNFQKDNDYFASVNQEQRIEIIDKIETTIASDVNIKSVNYSGNKIYFRSAVGGSVIYTLQVLADGEGKYTILEFAKGSTILNKWNIKGGTLSTTPKCEIVRTYDKTLHECNIEVYTKNTNNMIYYHNGRLIDNNNTIDDLVFSVMY
ncbi:MAG: hypothetical protein E7164_02990 [Firmicutes bacterium]|nr:hypothetical protein [Bacillota bacterium]